MTRFEITGRDAELDVLSRFLERSADGRRALVLEGAAGIGKSTIWLRGLELGHEQGLRILSSRPAEAEQDLAFAGLGDLFEEVLDDVLPALPTPRRHALEVALLLEQTQEPLDPRALGVALKSALELLSEARPLLLAVDDVQWLDGASANALAFALRRTSAALHLLLARRIGEQGQRTSVESSLPEASVERVPVGPLSVGALQAVVRERLDRVFPRPTLLRIYEMSGGNPFYALEISRVLPRDLDPSQPLRVPATLDELVRARAESLPEASRKALVLLAAMGEGDVATLREAGVESALDEPISRGIVARAGDRLGFTHPLLASSVEQNADEATRRSAHAVLAEVVDDPLERARHLALAAERPDAAIARTLDEAATSASARGAPRHAAELAELARRLTPDSDREGRQRRAIVGATSSLRAGDVRRAHALAEEAFADAVDDRARAEALVLMSAVAGADRDRERMIALRSEALSVAHSHPLLQSAIHQWLAANATEGRWGAGQERHARTSLELAERLGDDYLRAGAMAVLAQHRFSAGEPDALALAEQAHALATSPSVRAIRVQSSPEPAHLLAWTYDRLDLIASFVLADILICLRRFDAARAVLDDLDQELGGRDELLEAKTLFVRSTLEVDAGHWRLAHDLVSREREIDALYETSPNWPGPLHVLAELAIHRGDLDDARRLAAQSRELAEGRQGFLPHLEAVLGVADRVGGDSRAAIAGFAAAEAAAEAEGLREPTQLWWRADHAETLLELGRVDEAVEVLDAWEPPARRLGRDCTIAHITRCRGLVASAQGDLDLAVATLELAVDQTDASTDPFGQARALLALGVTRRRARKKRAAREAIEAALARFEQLGDVPWTQRARAELGRIGGRTREEGLTSAEQRVAALVAEGRTNREVAAALVLGERTVETHLTRIYAKLGVRSRTELARAYEPAP
jgi:DNA-binding NarL/FixJ family response regulator